MSIVSQRYKKVLMDVLNPKHIGINVKRRIRNENLVVIIGTAHRVGSTWLYELIKDSAAFELGSIWLPKEYKQTGTILLESPEAVKYLKGIRGYRIYKTHSYPISNDINDHLKFISIYRDPRDVITSSVFYLASIPPKQGGWGTDFKKLSEQQKIKHFIREGEFCLSRLERWFLSPGICQTKYEELKQQPVKELRRIMKYLGIDVDNKIIESVIAKHAFEAKSKRKPGQERKDSVLRKGITGDWRNYFDEECVDIFKHEKKGRWNRLVIDMGYENNLDW
jgi:hypothetical protein